MWQRELLRLSLCLLLTAAVLPVSILATSLHWRGLAALTIFAAGMISMWQIGRLSKAVTTNN